MICHFLLRRQRLCFAVARIFVRGLTYPKAVRESTRRMLRYSLLLVVPPLWAGAWRSCRGNNFPEGLLSSALGTVEASRIHKYIKSATDVTGFIALGNIF